MSLPRAHMRAQVQNAMLAVASSAVHVAALLHDVLRLAIQASV